MPSPLGSIRPLLAQPVVRWGLVWLAVWLALIAWRHDSLTSPPYWDSAMGLFVEANFLVESGFDYRRLFYDERRFAEGGSAIYLISLAPTLVAAALAWLPSPRAAIVVCHLVNLGVAACGAVVLATILARRVGWRLALLAAIALLTTPLFLAQLDLISLEVPVATLGLVMLACLDRQRYVAAALAALLAFAIKLSGAVLTMALGCYLLFALVVRPFQGERRQIVRLWLGLAAAFGNVVCICLSLDFLEGLPHSAANRSPTRWADGLASLAETRFWCPDLLVVTLASAIVSLAAAGQWWRGVAQSVEGAAGRGRSIVAIRAALWSEPLPCVSWIIVGGSVGFLALFYTIPRYLAVPLPFIWLALVVGAARWTPVRRWLPLALGAVIVFQVANREGRFYPALDQGGRAPLDRRNGAQLERSLEFWADHRANLAAVRVLEREAAESAIVASAPFVPFLALPRLGYVSRPLRGYSLGRFQPAGFPGIATLRDAPPERLTFVTVENRFTPLAEAAWPVPGDADEVVWSDDARSPLVIFRPRASADESPESAKQRDLSRLFPGDALWAEARDLVRRADWPAAAERYTRLVERMPWAPEVRLEFAWVLLAQGRAADAEPVLAELIRERPNALEPRLTQVRTLQALGRTADVERHWAELAVEFPRAMEVWLERARWEAQQRRFGSAWQFVEQAATLAPADPRPAALIGQIAALSGDVGTAERQLRRLQTLDATNAAIHLELGRLSQRDRPAEAIVAFQRALQIQPHHGEAANHLAWLWATHPEDSVRDAPRAIALLEPFCADEVAPSRWLDTLAAAYAAAERWEEAIAAAERALARNRVDGNAERADLLAERLEAYRRRQIPPRNPAPKRGSNSPTPDEPGTPANP